MIWSKFVPGPDFPTGGIIVENKDSITETYRTGRGSFRVRARWTKEETGRGTWVIVITEIPYLVQKSRLIEKIAELLNERKLPLIVDVRDESAEDVRIVIEPKSRTVDPELLMETLFKLTELENRIPMNMNVLSNGVTPRVLGGGKNMMLGNLIELQFGQGRNWPLGAALSVTLLAIVMVALLVYVRYAQRGSSSHG